MVCSTCGREVPENSQICLFCGKNMGVSKASQKASISPGRVYLIIMSAIYGIALLTCFICNLAVSHGLTWFFIVLCSVGIAFSITNLPFVLKKQRLIIPALAVTILIYALLFTCIGVANPGALRIAFQITTLPVIIAWLVVLVIKLPKINSLFKSAIISLLSGVLMLVMNVWVSVVLEGNMRSFSHFFSNQFGSDGAGYMINAVVAGCFFAYFIVGTVLGIIALNKQKQK